jgi:hypothetical protein
MLVMFSGVYLLLSTCLSVIRSAFFELALDVQLANKMAIKNTYVVCKNAHDRQRRCLYCTTCSTVFHGTGPDVRC